MTENTKTKAPSRVATKTPVQLAAELKIDSRALRRRLRLMAKDKKLDHDGRKRWVFTAADVAKIKTALKRSTP